MTPQVGGSLVATAHRPLRAAVFAALCVCGSAVAQTLPHESSQRFDFGTRIGQQKLPPGATVEPRLDGALQYAHNTGLESQGGEDALGLEVSPGIYAAYNSPAFVGALDYSLIGRVWDDGSLDDLTHALDANGRWDAVRDLLFFDGDATYSDTVADLTQGANYGGLGVFNTDNIVDQATFSVGPTLRKRLKDFQFEASYRYGQVWYLNEGDDANTPTFGSLSTDDSKDQRANVSLGLAPDVSKIDGRVFYSWEHSDFENSLPYEFERAGFEGGYELSRTLALVGDVGKESALDESASEGGLDSDFWSAGLRWEPSSRSHVEARYGDRFFGSSYSIDVAHAARFIEMTASYAEEPQVDTRRRSLGQFEPGELPPWLDQNLGYSAFNSAPYVGKDAALAVTARGSRTYITLSATNSRRTYVDEFLGDEEGTGIRLLGSRDLASNLSVDLQVSYTDYKREASLQGPLGPVPESHDYDTEITARGNREFGPRLIGSLEAGFFNRAGTNDYDGWWLGVRARWFPDFGK